MKAEEMQAHLDELCEQEGVRLDQPEIDTPGMMYVEFGYLEGPQIVETNNYRYPNAESRYLTCLHEIGHYAYGHTQGRPLDDYLMKMPDYFDPEFFDIRDFYFQNGVLKSEAEAWNWALDHCKIPSDEIKPETRSFMWDTCLGSYFSHAQSVGFETPGQLLYNGDRAYVSFAYGKPDRYFYQTKRRIIEGDNEEDMNRAKASHSLEERISGITDEQLNEALINAIDWRTVPMQNTWTNATTIIYGAGS